MQTNLPVLKPYLRHRRMCNRLRDFTPTGVDAYLTQGFETSSYHPNSDNKCNVPQNYDHMSLWCGGIAAQHDIYGGKCDICGDGYGDDYRPNRYPGKYATGIISRSYFEPGQVLCFINIK